MILEQACWYLNSQINSQINAPLALVLFQTHASNAQH